MDSAVCRHGLSILKVATILFHCQPAAAIDDAVSRRVKTEKHPGSGQPPRVMLDQTPAATVSRAFSIAMAQHEPDRTRRKRLPRLEVFPPTKPDGIVHGREIALYYGAHGPATWERHQRTQLEIALFFTPAIVRVGWQEGTTWHEQEMRGPHVCVIAPDLPHCCHLESDAELLVLYVERSLARRLAKRKFTGVVFGEAAHHDLVVWFLASALRELCADRGPRDQWMVDGIGARLMRRLVPWLCAQGNSPRPRGPVLTEAELGKVVRYIQANLKHDIHVVDLAKQTGHSVPHFAELFKNKTQLSPYHYLKEVRMMKAYQLILTGDYKVREVALAVGYTNADHFSEVFRKTFKESASVLLGRARR